MCKCKSSGHVCPDTTFSECKRLARPRNELLRDWFGLGLPRVRDLREHTPEESRWLVGSQLAAGAVRRQTAEATHMFASNMGPRL